MYNTSVESATCDIENDSKIILTLKTKNSTTLNLDSIIFATGVSPSTSLQGLLSANSKLSLSPTSGAIEVNKQMQSVSHCDVYAVGDCCECGEMEKEHLLWFQMRLWTQASKMGIFAARNIIGR